MTPRRLCGVVVEVGFGLRRPGAAVDVAAMVERDDVIEWCAAMFGRQRSTTL
jgi:hypothetical protein